MDYKSSFLRHAQERGFIHQCSDESQLDQLLASKQGVGAYVGFDATASSLHVGHLVSIMLLRLLQKCGHRPILLLGGGTTRVGDPSGKEETRRLLDDATIQANLESFRTTFGRFLDFSGDHAAKIFDNAQWLSSLDHLSFLRDVGRHFSVNRMLGLESVKQRLGREQNLSFLEFNYMVLQAYDFLEMSRRADCQVQMGGSDQWGNILCGVDLVRRMDDKRLFALTAPLIVMADGKKMGKTVQGAVWLDETKTTIWDYWQFWRNTADGDVARFLKMFTDLKTDEIDRLCRDDAINEAKKILANEATALCHGVAAAGEASEKAAQVFERGGRGGASVMMQAARVDQGLNVFQLLEQCGLAASKSEGRRLIRAGAISLNGQKVTEETRPVTLDDFDAQGGLHVAAGKKRHCLVKLGSM